LEWKLLYILRSFWNMLCPLGIIYSSLVKFMGHLVYFSHFGMFVARKIWQPWAKLEWPLKKYVWKKCKTCKRFENLLFGSFGPTHFQCTYIPTAGTLRRRYGDGPITCGKCQAGFNPLCLR
jgi:hypothetical protein